MSMQERIKHSSTNIKTDTYTLKLISGDTVYYYNTDGTELTKTNTQVNKMMADSD